MSKSMVAKEGRAMARRKPGDRSVSAQGVAVVESPDIPLKPFPEWNDEEVSQDKFFVVPRAAGARDEGAWEDPDVWELPTCLKDLVGSWKRLSELDDAPVIVPQRPNVIKQDDGNSAATSATSATLTTSGSNIGRVGRSGADGSKKKGRKDRRDRRDLNSPSSPQPPPISSTKEVVFSIDETDERLISAVDDSIAPNAGDEDISLSSDDPPGWEARKIDNRLLAGPFGIESDISAALLLRWIASLFDFVAQQRHAVREGEFLWELISPKSPSNGPPSYNPCGKYAVKLFVQGKWRRVLVDDRVPCDSDGTPLLVRSGDKHAMWPLLLSKAILKVMNGSDVEAEESLIHWICGWIPNTQKIRRKTAYTNIVETLKDRLTTISDPKANPPHIIPKTKTDCPVIANPFWGMKPAPTEAIEDVPATTPHPQVPRLGLNKSKETISGSNSVQDRPEEPRSDVDVVAPIKVVFAALPCSNPTEKQRNSFKKFGLVNGAAYSIIDARVARGKEMICLGSSLADWSGRYSDMDTTSWMPSFESGLECTLEQRQKRNKKLGFVPDFWMSFDDFCHFFDRILVLWNPKTVPFRHSITEFWDDPDQPHRNPLPQIMFVASDKHPITLRVVLHCAIESSHVQSSSQFRIESFDWAYNQLPHTVLSLDASRMNVATTVLPAGKHMYSLSITSPRGCAVDIYSTVSLIPVAPPSRSLHTPGRTPRSSRRKALADSQGDNDYIKASPERQRSVRKLQQIDTDAVLLSPKTPVPEVDVPWADIGPISKILKDRSCVKILEAGGDVPPILPGQWHVWFRQLLRVKGDSTPVVLHASVTDPAWTPLLHVVLVNNTTMEQTHAIVGPLDGILQTPLTVLHSSEAGYTVLGESLCHTPPPGPARWNLRVISEAKSGCGHVSWEFKGAHGVTDIDGVSTPTMRDSLVFRVLTRVREPTPCSLLAAMAKPPRSHVHRFRIEVWDGETLITRTEGAHNLRIPAVILRPNEREGRGKSAVEVVHKYAIQVYAMLDPAGPDVNGESDDESISEDHARMTMSPSIVDDSSQSRSRRPRRRDGEHDGRTTPTTMAPSTSTAVDGTDSSLDPHDIAWKLIVAYPQIGLGTAPPIPDLKKDTEGEERRSETKAKWEKADPGRAKRAAASREHFLSEHFGVTVREASQRKPARDKAGRGKDSARRRRDKEKDVTQQPDPVQGVDGVDIEAMSERDRIMNGVDDKPKDLLVLTGQQPMLKTEEIRRERTQQREHEAKEFQQHRDAVIAARQSERGLREEAAAFILSQLRDWRVGRLRNGRNAITGIDAVRQKISQEELDRRREELGEQDEKDDTQVQGPDEMDAEAVDTYLTPQDFRRQADAKPGRSPRKERETDRETQRRERRRARQRKAQ